MSRLFVSVLLPVYNVQDYLQECLNSLFVQTYTNYEIVAVDDGSTDASSEILKANAEKHSCLHVVRQENKGLAGARNTALQYAKGDVIAFVDSDDFVSNDYLEKMVCTMLSTVSDVVVYGRYIYSDKMCVHQQRPGFSEQKLSKGDALRALNSYTSFDMSMCSKLIRKTLFEGLVFPEGKNSEDQFLCFRLLSSAEGVFYCDEPIYYYRHRFGSISRGSKVNVFPMEASQEQYEYLCGEGIALERAAAASCFFSAVAVFNAYAVRGMDIPTAPYRTIVETTRKHLASTLKNLDIPKYKKIQAVLFCFSKSLYKQVYLRRRA